MTTKSTKSIKSNKTKSKAYKVRLLEGLPVVDGTKDIMITVNSQDIKDARKNSPASCAAARAGERIFNTEVRVFLARTYIKRKDKWERYLTPVSASREIVSFDRGASFEPGEYKIKTPSPAQQLGVHRGRSTRTGEGDKRVTHHKTARVREWRDRK